MSRTITERALALKADAVEMRVFDRDARMVRAILKTLCEKHGFRTAFISSAEEQHLILTTARMRVTL